MKGHWAARAAQPPALALACMLLADSLPCHIQRRGTVCMAQQKSGTGARPPLPLLASATGDDGSVVLLLLLLPPLMLVAVVKSSSFRASRLHRAGGTRPQRGSACTQGCWQPANASWAGPEQDERCQHASAGQQCAQPGTARGCLVPCQRGTCVRPWAHLGRAVPLPG